MVRTQIYLTETEKSGLAEASATVGLSQSDLIRRAIDTFLSQSQGKDRSLVIKDVTGIWAERSDIPDLDEMRSGWNSRRV